MSCPFGKSKSVALAWGSSGEASSSSSKTQQDEEIEFKGMHYRFTTELPKPGKVYLIMRPGSTPRCGVLCDIQEAWDSIIRKNLPQVYFTGNAYCSLRDGSRWYERVETFHPDWLQPPLDVETNPAWVVDFMDDVVKPCPVSWHKNDVYRVETTNGSFVLIVRDQESNSWVAIPFNKQGVWLRGGAFAGKTVQAALDDFKAYVRGLKKDTSRSRAKGEKLAETWAREMIFLWNNARFSFERQSLSLTEYIQTAEAAGYTDLFVLPDQYQNLAWCKPDRGLDGSEILIPRSAPSGWQSKPITAGQAVNLGCPGVIPTWIPQKGSLPR